MTKTMKQLFGIVLMLMVSMVTSAQETNGEEPQVANEQTPQVKVDIPKFEGGTIIEKGQNRVVTRNEKEEETVTYEVTITVTPDEGFFITKNDIVVMATLPLNTKTRSENEEGKVAELAGKLELQGDDPEDLSKEREYTFTIEDGFGAWVMEANFHTAALVLGSDVTEMADESLAGVTSIKIENTAKVVGLGENSVKGITVTVPGNLYNEYRTTEGWSEANIIVDEENSVKMTGVNFTSANDYAPYYSSKAVVVPSVLKAYTVNGLDKDENLILNDVGNVIPAEEPVLLFSKEIDDDDFRTVLSEPDEEQKDGGAERTRAAEVKNALQVVTDDTKTDEKGLYVELGQVYMLYNDVFYFTQAGYIPVGGIYLDPKALVVVDEEEPAAPMKARFYLGMPNDAGTTGIKEKVIANSEKLSDAWYTLSGRRLNAAPTAKGLYIHDGKKVIIR